MTSPSPLTAALACAAGAIAASALLLWLRDLRVRWADHLLRPAVTGLVLGAAGLFLAGDRAVILTFAVLVTVAAFYVFRRSSTPVDPFDAAAVGAALGVGASLPALAMGGDDPRIAAAASIVGAVAGAIAFSTVDRGTWRSPAALLTAALSAIGYHLVRLMTPPDAATAVAVSAAAAPAVILFADLFGRAPSITRELEEESSIGVIPPELVRDAAHPIRRLRRGAWQDREARRRFRTRARDLAVRKIQQRTMDPERARLHQLEILKLRMELQQILGVERAMLRDAQERRRTEEASATMPPERMRTPD